jgi:hypothetical protein
VTTRKIAARVSGAATGCAAPTAGGAAFDRLVFPGMIIEFCSINEIQASRIGRARRPIAGLHEDALIDHVSVVSMPLR